MKPLPLTLLLALAACGGPAASPSAEAQLFRRELCSSCHGPDAGGTWMGPPLRGLDAHWDEASLADFLLDPRPFVRDDPRLQALLEGYPNPMVGNRTLGAEERRRLAAWLLQR